MFSVTPGRVLAPQVAARACNGRALANDTPIKPEELGQVAREHKNGQQPDHLHAHHHGTGPAFRGKCEDSVDGSRGGCQVALEVRNIKPCRQRPGGQRTRTNEERHKGQGEWEQLGKQLQGVLGQAAAAEPADDEERHHTHDLGRVQRDRIRDDVSNDEHDQNRPNDRGRGDMHEPGEALRAERHGEDDH